MQGKGGGEIWRIYGKGVNGMKGLEVKDGVKCGEGVDGGKEMEEKDEVK